MNKHKRALKFSSMTALMQNEPKTDWASLFQSILHFKINPAISLAIVLFFAVSTTAMALIIPSEFSVADYQPLAVHNPHSDPWVLGAETAGQGLPAKANTIFPLNARSYAKDEEATAGGEPAVQKIYDGDVFKVYLRPGNGKPIFPAGFLIEINDFRAETDNMADAQTLRKSLLIVVDFSNTLSKFLSSAQANSAVFEPPGQ